MYQAHKVMSAFPQTLLDPFELLSCDNPSLLFYFPASVCCLCTFVSSGFAPACLCRRLTLAAGLCQAVPNWKQRGPVGFCPLLPQHQMAWRPHSAMWITGSSWPASCLSSENPASFFYKPISPTCSHTAHGCCAFVWDLVLEICLPRSHSLSS